MERTADELRQQIDLQRQEVGHDLAAIGDRVTPSRIAGRGQARARRRVIDLRERVMGTAGTVGDRTSSMTGQVTGTVSEAPGQVAERVEGNPLMAGAIAFGFGMLVGSLLPATSKERQLGQGIQPQLEQAAQGAAQIGQQVVEEVRPTAEAELGALKDEAKGAAQSAKGTATEHAQQARTEVMP